ncbi:MAG TPA: ABC transporter substrate-binding protein [Euzebyales bacterium]|nr:ABC transporter substrate-binding protein [Euzebyales bacterium]
MLRSPAARAALALLLLLLTACAGATGASDTTPTASATATATDSPTAAASGGFPVTVEAANGAVTIDAPPEAIVSLSPTATEMLFAIDAGEQVVAADSFSNFPSQAPTTDLSASEPNVEAIAGYAPDLVVFGDDPGDLGSALEELDIPALSLPAAATLDDTYDQITQLGTATGHADSATALVERMRDDIDKIVGDAPSAAAAAPTFYHELDDTYFSVTSKTFIGQLYDMLGLRNIADDASTNAGDYPQLSSEFIVDADPDLIFLADTKCCAQSAETVARRPGWEQLTAVTSDGVVPLDDDVASRWGPRVVDLLQNIADAVETHGGATTP